MSRGLDNVLLDISWDSLFAGRFKDRNCLSGCMHSKKTVTIPLCKIFSRMRITLHSICLFPFYAARVPIDGARAFFGQ